MTEIALKLLGGFSVVVEGDEVPNRNWRLRKARTLVKLVALQPGRQLHRERAMELLWPDLDATRAQNNLYQVVHAARQVLGADPLVVKDGLLVLDTAVASDIDTFERLASAAWEAADPAAYEAAIGAYAGELLPEDRYEPWAEPRRTALRERLAGLCLQLADLYVEQGRSQEAVDVLQHAIDADPLHEAAHRALMRLYDSSGRRQEALAQYHRLRAALREELAAEPDPETRSLYRTLLTSTGREGGEVRSERQPLLTGRLPGQATSFVGRERELAEIGRLLERTRLLTLSGPGGSGKSRLAIEAAGRAAGRHADGLWFVELGGISDPALVSEAAATAVGMPVPSQRSAAEALAEYLDGRRALIVLDTCEHVIDACASLAETLLRHCPAITLLATSREPLRCAGETAWRVPGLAVPARDEAVSLADVQQIESVRLFVTRAAEAAPAFELSAENFADVAAICFRLDGMPLALELAAARTSILAPAQVAARLEHSLDILAGGTRTARTRQQTLRATIAWSHDLLEEEERVLFRRLAVFAGSFALEAAEVVCTDETIEPRSVLDLVARLVDKSLLTVDDAAAARYRLLDTIRQFAAEQLAGAGERSGFEARHRAWAQTLAEAHDPATSAGGRSRSLQRLETDHDNLRAALASGLRDEPSAALRLGVTAWRFWLDRNYFTEGSRRLAAALAATDEDNELRVRALLAAAALALRRGDLTAIGANALEAETTARRLGDPILLADVLQAVALVKNANEGPVAAAATGAAALERIGSELTPAHAAVRSSALHVSALALYYLGEIDAARERIAASLSALEDVPYEQPPFFEGMTFGFVILPEGTDGALRPLLEETIMLFHRFSRGPAVAHALCNLAILDRVDGRAESARAQLDDALERFRAAGDDAGEALALTGLGNWARSFGDHAAGLEYLEEALSLRRARGDRRSLGITENDLALLLAYSGDLQQARRLFAEGRERFWSGDDIPGVCGVLMSWAVAEERAGELDRAARMLVEAGTLWERHVSAHLASWAWLAAGDVLDRAGRRESAAEALRHAEARFESVGVRHGVDLCRSHPAAKAVQRGRKSPPQ